MSWTLIIIVFAVITFGIIYYITTGSNSGGDNGGDNGGGGGGSGGGGGGNTTNYFDKLLENKLYELPYIIGDVKIINYLDRNNKTWLALKYKELDAIPMMEMCPTAKYILIYNNTFYFQCDNALDYYTKRDGLITSKPLSWTNDTRVSYHMMFSNLNNGGIVLSSKNNNIINNSPSLVKTDWANVKNKISGLTPEMDLCPFMIPVHGDSYGNQLIWQPIRPKQSSSYEDAKNKYLILGYKPLDMYWDQTSPRAFNASIPIDKKESADINLYKAGITYRNMINNKLYIATNKNGFFTIFYENPNSPVYNWTHHILKGPKTFSTFNDIPGAIHDGVHDWWNSIYFYDTASTNSLSLYENTPISIDVPIFIPNQKVYLQPQWNSKDSFYEFYDVSDKVTGKNIIAKHQPQVTCKDWNIYLEYINIGDKDKLNLTEVAGQTGNLILNTITVKTRSCDRDMRMGCGNPYLCLVPVSYKITTTDIQNIKDNMKLLE